MSVRTHFKWYGDEVAKEAHAAASEGLDDAAEFLLSEANKTAPLDEGTLRRSATTDVDGGALQAVVSYDTPYAAALHEGSGMNFQEPKARHKWLQLALQENAVQIRDYIANKIKGALGG